jgi:hypothetical protein
MAMVPHQPALVKRLAGKPFALVGVSRNETRQGLKKCEEKHGMLWRSFFDGQEGPISKRYNIKFMPTVYVLDARGVIRYKGPKGRPWAGRWTNCSRKWKAGRNDPRRQGSARRL